MNEKMLAKRIEILQKIDALQLKCNCQNALESEACSNCKKIAKYGQRLLGLVNKRNSVSENKPKTNNRKGFTKLTITEFQYKEYKRQKITDREIAKNHDVCVSTLKKWKQRNGVA
ncbi:hypothetical protein ABIA69_001919 [Lysinibacillus parviboronicapiens]|uniref:Uncharacterized protein n=1 Tax=Lysinibacillus parviboronicapiens TaxID=436516 RepID=A0ABV2PIJ0_9BACI